MTGAETLAMVKGALNTARSNADARRAIVALDGCIVLTAEEARELVDSAHGYINGENLARFHLALCLLTPEAS